MIEQNQIPSLRGNDVISPGLLHNYFRSLVGCFFKILPIKEDEVNGAEKTLDTYMRSLQAELMGCSELVESIHEDSRLLTLLGILQYLIDTPEASVQTVKREVFKAISICEALKAQYPKVVQ